MKGKSKGIVTEIYDVNIKSVSETDIKELLKVFLFEKAQDCKFTRGDNHGTRI